MAGPVLGFNSCAAGRRAAFLFRPAGANGAQRFGTTRSCPRASPPELRAAGGELRNQAGSGPLPPVDGAVGGGIGAVGPAGAGAAVRGKGVAAWPGGPICA